LKLVAKEVDVLQVRLKNLKVDLKAEISGEKMIMVANKIGASDIMVVK
jgi:hypothetical protein